MLRKLQGSSTAFLIRVMASPLLLAFIFLVILESPATANLIIDEVYSREELVKMAGYGEDKISTVQIEGKVVCQTCSDGADERSSLHPISDMRFGGGLVIKGYLGSPGHLKQ
nr:PAB-dependent poly(A)-specific ribonuclease [Ipomoea batatas]